MALTRLVSDKLTHIMVWLPLPRRKAIGRTCYGVSVAMTVVRPVPIAGPVSIPATALEEPEPLPVGLPRSLVSLDRIATTRPVIVRAANVRLSATLSALLQAGRTGIDMTLLRTRGTSGAMIRGPFLPLPALLAHRTRRKHEPGFDELPPDSRLTPPIISRSRESNRALAPRSTQPPINVWTEKETIDMLTSSMVTA